MNARNPQQERELGGMEAKIDFLVENSAETKADVKELVAKVAIQNGRVTSNEKGLADIIQTVGKLSEREQGTYIWRKNVVYAAGGLGTLFTLIVIATVPLAISKAKADVQEIIAEQNHILKEEIKAEVSLNVKKEIQDSIESLFTTQ